MEDLHIALIQAPLVWEDKKANLSTFEKLIDGIPNSQDLILLPEMFNTGFSMRPELLAESPEGATSEWMKSVASDTGSVIAGTLMIEEDGQYLNRSLWVFPDGSTGYYDKRHLFTMGGEDRHFASGAQRTIIQIKGWNIMPLTCYDLRFPVWSRNQYRDNTFQYDLLCYLANWPAVRSHHWRQLLSARAIENQCFVAGVNCTGTDGNGINHHGDSMIVDAYGTMLADAEDQPTAIITSILKGKHLRDYRKKFFVAADWNNELEL